jgi:rfaE bifunctional protein kinase chain/domain
MAFDPTTDDIESLISVISEKAGKARKVVFVSGNFNLIHPGHLRLLNFASECGDFLVVGVTRNDVPGALIPEDLRLAGVRSISCVGYAFLLPVAPETLVAALKPALVVKGKEHEAHFNPEQAIVESYGGKLLFSSGEARFSSMDLLQRELLANTVSTIAKPADYPLRHGFDGNSLHALVSRFSSLRVVVVGDLIVDEYITCDPIGMSQEDPTIVVTPIKYDMFVGGAGIVAAHARGLGAQVRYFGVAGDDATAVYARETLERHGVEACLIRDDSRPTTLKQRYRARSKTLLRVSHLRQHDISHETRTSMMEEIEAAIGNADLLVFSDFNYGCLPQPLVDAITDCCRRQGVPMVADSQSSSQVGDVSRFEGMLLLTPTEHEARLALRDSASGLVVLADALQRKSHCKHVIVTLSAEGILVHSQESSSGGLVTDKLPSFNNVPKDVSGAGDCLFICASMALVAGGSIWESAYLGSIAAACQVGRVGNLPLSTAELTRELSL